MTTLKEYSETDGTWNGDNQVVLKPLQHVTVDFRISLDPKTYVSWAKFEMKGMRINRGGIPPIAPFTDTQEITGDTPWTYTTTENEPVVTVTLLTYRLRDAVTGLDAEVVYTPPPPPPPGDGGTDSTNIMAEFEKYWPMLVALFVAIGALVAIYMLFRRGD